MAKTTKNNSKSTRSQSKPKARTAVKKKVKKVVNKDTQISQGNLVASLISAYREGGDQEDRDMYCDILKKSIIQEVDQHSISKDYNLLILYDNSTMLKSDADQIYNAVTGFNEKKPILLILLSTGGQAGSAYLIGKLCREYSGGEFSIVVPRHAKSAATLLCCAANKIHMGSLSELGPIDPQINGLPALGLKNSIQHIAELVETNSNASQMFAKYLSLSIEPIQIGYYERVAESAMQYAENLLVTHGDNLPNDPKSIANDLVYKYKDHGYVIDRTEATKIFGKDIILHNTKEYYLGNSVYKLLELNERIASYLKHAFYFIGGVNSSPSLRKKK